MFFRHLMGVFIAVLLLLVYHRDEITSCLVKRTRSTFDVRTWCAKAEEPCNGRIIWQVMVKTSY